MTRKMIKKYLLLIGVMIMVLAITIPAVAAYEGHAIDVRARVQFDFGKTAKLATPEQITYAKDELGIAFPSDPVTAGVCFENGTWYVPLKQCVAWIVTIVVTNPYDYDMTNVKVQDHFNAELDIAVWDYCPNTSSVTLILGNQDRVQYWVIGTLEQDEVAILQLIVWTRLNNGGQQEYTSTGPHWINESGVTMWWDDADGKQQSRKTDSLLPVMVYDPKKESPCP
jgi:hypothetical protein